ncbi:MAG: arginine--tRNA ligase [Lachnospiraceae bacterium]|nr:arginine--tRNA ligase [Lachnospiraceae bacterium]
MKTILEQITDIVSEAFGKAGYDSTYGKVGYSNRPDLCEYQCNGAMAAAKTYHKAPIAIAEDVAGALSDNEAFSMISAVPPGFLNIRLSKGFLAKYLNEMKESECFGLEKSAPVKIIVDYGGPNVAKPLHVGHLRAAIIGESVKRICRYMGNEVIGDVHLGDWGLQMGLIITELKSRQPDLPYFDDKYTGQYPEEPPFTLSELEEIYPSASARSKEDEAFREEALSATKQLQKGERGYRALWQHIIDVSVPDLKRNYAELMVDFDWWKGESSVDPLIAPMVDDMKKKGFAHESEGALVVDVAEESDTKEVPPCMILKSDGAALYTTTDLATLLDRRQTFDPDRVIYVVDKRQDMHFVQVFRTARKCGIVREDTKLDFLGFGTMNGKDGKPFKTREGGVMRLERLIGEIKDTMYKKITENHPADPEEAKKTSETVAVAAIKYGDLSNQATKDYIFDVDKFTSFEGNTGPYILYTIVRIKSILAKYTESMRSGEEQKGGLPRTVAEARNEAEKALMLEISKFSEAVTGAYEEIAPHRICAYIYDVCNEFNRFYHETRILAEEDERKKSGWIALLVLTKEILEKCIDLLGFEAPDRM